ncbi:MAG: hypothetical protein H0T46_23660 [Deltaproteobacteria bacterium]|nr:hypothetical protein [Deltaproteobacteria bacterium]
MSVMRFSCWLWVLLATATCEDRKSQPTPPVKKSAPPQQCQPGERMCVRDEVVQCNADGSLGATLESCKGQCRTGACVDTCALQDVELIYVADDKSRLYSFDPRKPPADPFHPIGTIKCNDSSSLNSMAVDRSGIAWLGYHSGAVFRASIIDAHCTTPGSVPRGAPTTFGMGFATDGPKATTEKLFVAGGRTTKSLAVLETSATPLAWTRVASFDAARDHPELTGTGDGRLFGYFPSPNLGVIEELDKTTAKAIGERWVLEGPGKRVTAYAFAHWGGVFYVFFTVDGSSSVHAVHMKTGKQERLMTNLPMGIVGAGVSTCAPLLERVP